MREVRVALNRYVYEVSRLPYPGAFGFIHQNISDLIRHDFHIKQKPWLNPFELASIANYVALFGSTKRNHRRLFDISPPLNTLKVLWKLAEKEGEYSSSLAYEATFVLRWVYQQLPFTIHPLRIRRVLSLVGEIFSSDLFFNYMPNKIGLSGKMLVATSTRLLEHFSKSSMSTEQDLLGLTSASAMASTLKLLAVARPARLTFFNQKLRVESPVEKPYEVNSLLRFPIAKHDGNYYAPYPGLIGYAATRGLIFRLAEEDKEKFREPFVRSYEEKTTQLLKDMMPEAEILTEEDERRLGWAGKTNDVTAILGDCAVLIECKLSGLFVEAKRSASPELMLADVRKQIADGKSRRGLFQLHDKCLAIRSKLLPPALMERYKTVRRFFPVLLLFDAVQHANAAETLGNIIGEELRAYDVAEFDYQIWHLEELSWLAEYCGESAMEWIADKFSARNRNTDLNTFIADKAGKTFLKPVMYMPQGNDKAFEILARLSKKYGP